MPETYTFNEKTGVHRLRFGIGWPDDYDQPTTVYTYNGWGKFGILGVKSEDTYGYTIQLAEHNDATSEMAEETSAALDISSNDSMNTRMSVKVPQDSAMDPSKVDADNDHLEPRVKRMRGPDPYTIGAHKLMLCQWPYFKAMLEELTDIARASILSKLKPKQFVPFLFRTAYLFTDLREPVIKFVAQSCGEILTSKDTRATYFDHPEGVQIFGELLE
ncbi:hypothetical protein BG006_009802 [Podila minutissima]|uniref:Uncharacterized protein n=1 Tax=Podila minutissima TaxID=64525 RepID=A0A9P5SGN2_9FUNG|nr:hypothetical protein BG006_009802 [Podila minutissima]